MDNATTINKQQKMIIFRNLYRLHGSHKFIKDIYNSQFYELDEMSFNKREFSMFMWVTSKGPNHHHTKHSLNDNLAFLSLVY